MEFFLKRKTLFIFLFSGIIIFLASKAKYGGMLQKLETISLFTKVGVIGGFALLFLLRYMYYRLLEEKNMSSLKMSGYSLVLLAIGMVLLFLRNADPVCFPILYAEDSEWLSLLLTTNIKYTALHARPDFPIVGMALFLQGALLVSQVLFGYDLSYLPVICAVFSYGFVAAIALIGYWVFRKFSRGLAILVYLSVLFMPLGSDGNEVFGRILNLGFLFPTLTTFCLIQRSREKSYNTRVFCIDLINAVSCWTMPVSFGIVGVYILVEVVAKRNNINWKEIFKWCLLPLITVMSLLINMQNLLHSQGATKGVAVVQEHLVEFIIGRCILFPFVSGYWRKLNDEIVVTLGVVYLLVLLVAGWLVWQKKKDVWYGILLSSMLVYWGGLAITRVGLTAFLEGYKNSFPDRYFYGLNILAIVAFFSALYIMSQYFKLNAVKWLLGGGLMLSLLCSGHIFDFENPAMKWRSRGTFQQQVQAIVYQNTSVSGINQLQYLVQTYPDAWKVAIPAEYARKTAAPSR